MHTTHPEPSLDRLLDQYEDIGGPELFGPVATAMILALWRKSKKLGWASYFTLTTTELHYLTGIKSRETLNKHRKKLVAAGLLRYKEPPKGMSRGDYTLCFRLDPARVVQQMDNLADSSPEETSELVQQMDDSDVQKGKPVQQMDSPVDTVLKELTVTTTESAFSELMAQYCALHGKLDIQVSAADITAMSEVIAKGIPVELVTKVMRQLHGDRTSRGTRINTFGYYKHAILDAWDAQQAITDEAPSSSVALGKRPITDRVPVPAVALGSKHQRAFDLLDQIAEEETT